MNEVEKAKQVLKDAGYVDTLWHIDDIIGKAEDMNVILTEDQVNAVRADIEHNHDANYGVDWDTIESAINDALKP